MRIVIAVFTAILMLTGSAMAAIQTKTIEYEQGGVTLEGVLVYEDTVSALRPGVVVVHQWMGLGEYEIERARMLVELGYVAFCADIYGKGVRPASAAEAGEQATLYRSDRALMRARAQAGLDVLKSQVFVDAGRTAAIGYCFGGGVVLELARSGAELDAVVSFHGNLDTPDSADASNIQCRVLVCHGAADPHVPMEQVIAFHDEMEAAGVDYELDMYGGAVHAFTHWNLEGADPATGAAYNEAADKSSWAAMQRLFGECF